MELAKRNIANITPRTECPIIENYFYASFRLLLFGHWNGTKFLWSKWRSAQQGNGGNLKQQSYMARTRFAKTFAFWPFWLTFFRFVAFVVNIVVVIAVVVIVVGSPFLFIYFSVDLVPKKSKKSKYMSTINAYACEFINLIHDTTWTHGIVNKHKKICWAIYLVFFLRKFQTIICDACTSLHTNID